MVDYMQDGAIDGALLNRELHIVEILVVYLQKLIEIDDFERQHSVLRAFFISFKKINE